MSRRYKNLLPLLIDGEHKQGDIFEKELTADEELENVRSGLLEIQPQTYKVIGGSRVYETNPGDTFEVAMTLGQEQLLVEGGQIEVVPEKKATTKKAKEAN